MPAGGWVARVAAGLAAVGACDRGEVARLLIAVFSSGALFADLPPGTETSASANLVVGICNEHSTP